MQNSYSGLAFRPRSRMNWCSGLQFLRSMAKLARSSGSSAFSQHSAVVVDVSPWLGEISNPLRLQCHLQNQLSCPHIYWIAFQPVIVPIADRGHAHIKGSTGCMDRSSHAIKGLYQPRGCILHTEHIKAVFREGAQLFPHAPHPALFGH